MKRVFDIVFALLGLTAVSPVLFVLCFLIWLQDRHSPLYTPKRMGRGEIPYRIIKIRSMVVRADDSNVDSTANNDPRITHLGQLIRRFKLDELPQLWNVLTGEMSFVGPRPNVERETRLYSREEKRLFSVRPGITDIASIVFADLGATLEGKSDPNIAYNQIVRPYKSRLGLFYIDHASLWLDLQLLWLTALNAINRRAALDRLYGVVVRLGATPELVKVVRRSEALEPAPPPGMTEIVTTRGN